MTAAALQTTRNAEIYIQNADAILGEILSLCAARRTVNDMAKEIEQVQRTQSWAFKALIGTLFTIIMALAGAWAHNIGTKQDSTDTHVHKLAEQVAELRGNLFTKTEAMAMEERLSRKFPPEWLVKSVDEIKQRLSSIEDRIHNIERRQ